MLEAILKKILFNIAMKKAMARAEKKDKEFIENYTSEQTDENVIFKGYEYQYLENLAAASRMVAKSVYERVVSSYTLYYEDYLYLNNYKKEGKNITYQQLAECKKSGNFKYNKGRGIVTIKLDDKQKYQMFVCGSDTDRTKETEITEQIADFLQKKCGMQIV